MQSGRFNHYSFFPQIPSFHASLRLCACKGEKARHGTPLWPRDILAGFEIARDRTDVWNDESHHTVIPCEPCLCPCKGERRDMEPRFGATVKRGSKSPVIGRTFGMTILGGTVIPCEPPPLPLQIHSSHTSILRPRRLPGMQRMAALARDLGSVISSGWISGVSRN